MGFVDILASDGHMKWLQGSSETLHCAWRDWLQSLADFVAVFPILDARQIMDDGRGVSDNTPMGHL